MALLRKISAGKVDVAINQYFDGSLDRIKSPKIASTLTSSPSKKMLSQSKSQPLLQKSSQSQSKLASDGKLPFSLQLPPVTKSPEPTWVKRYIGSFQSSGYITRSGPSATIVQYNDTLSIERMTILGKNLTTVKNNKDDCVVRLLNNRTGRDFARLPEETARFVSTMLECDICEFSAVCVYAEEGRIRIGDTFYIQIHCFLKESIFGRDLLADTNKVNDQKADAPSSSAGWAAFNNAKETLAEKLMRFRQAGLVQLFDKLDITHVDNGQKPQSTANLVKAIEDGIKNREELANRETVVSDCDDNNDDNDVGKIDKDQLDALYRRSQAPLLTEELSPPTNTFRLSLRKYQKQGLKWMVDKEERVINTPKSNSDTMKEPMHPLWQEFKWPTPPSDLLLATPMSTDTSTGKFTDTFYVNFYSGELSVEYPTQKKTVRGGILADEMGLGKTISTLALIHTNQYDENDKEEADLGDNYARYTTLVVAPMSLLAQWESEVANCSMADNIMGKSMLYYGDNVHDLRSKLCGPGARVQAPRVVITSFGVVMSEYNQVNNGASRKNGLFGVNFYRVVLDEAHTIKNRNTKTAKSCYALNAERKWALTGTPIVNRLEDLFSLIKYLKVEPWNDFSFWRTFITVPFESKDVVRALNVVQSVFEPLVLRRTKDMKQPDGTPLITLPPKVVEIEQVDLSEDERVMYNHIFRMAKGTYQESVGNGTMMKSYTAILSQILRLRQVCCHPYLVSNAASLNSAAIDDLDEGTIINPSCYNEDIEAIIQRFSTPETPNETPVSSYGKFAMDQIVNQAMDTECPICTAEPIAAEQLGVTPCWHFGCLGCLEDHIEYQIKTGAEPRCHICRKPLARGEIMEVLRVPQKGDSHNNIDVDQVTMRPYRGNLGQSAKTLALLKHLKRTRSQDPLAKCVVFSQFTSFLDIIGQALTRDKFHVLRFDGTLSQRERTRVLDSFRDSIQPGTVLLLSLKAGGVGLNLVSAKFAFLMDPWWSFAVEAQAIDRIHRMGQTADVKVVRFIVKDTVELRMLKIQERKMFLATSLGMSEQEKKQQRIEDIKSLFE
ncbi:hypothetical protein NADFUDRAFT_39087, partial [Nadsonia fulvescens var. elongata DSM 6958]